MSIGALGIGPACTDSARVLPCAAAFPAALQTVGAPSARQPAVHCKPSRTSAVHLLLPTSDDHRSTAAHHCVAPRRLLRSTDDARRCHGGSRRCGITVLPPLRGF